MTCSQTLLIKQCRNVSNTMQEMFVQHTHKQISGLLHLCLLSSKPYTTQEWIQHVCFVCTGRAKGVKTVSLSIRKSKQQLSSNALKQEKKRASGITSSIVTPVIDANNFELNPALITFIEREQLKVED